jgi:hypothetical protein
VTLDNGTRATVHVETSSAKVGFTDCYQTQEEYRGIVPNLLDSTINQRLKMSTQEIAADRANRAEDDSKNEPPVAQGGHIIEGSISYKGEAQTPIITGGINRIYSHSNSIGNTQLTIDANHLDQFTLPTTLAESSEFELSPLTTIHLASTDVHYEAMFWNGAVFPQQYNMVVDSTKNIVYPFNIKCENEVAISRFVFKIAIVSENNPTVIVNGKPLDPSLINDYEINSWGLDPSIDDFTETQGIGYGTSMEFIIIVIVIVVVVVVVVGTVIYLKKKGSGGGFSGWFNKIIIRG